MKIDLQKLSLLANSALAANTAKQNASIAKKNTSNAAKDQRDKDRAAKIIAKIPDKCERAAARGDFSVSVMRLSYNSFNMPIIGSGCGVWNIIGAAKIVFHACEAAGLDPKIEEVSDGIGINSYYLIKARWL